MKRGFSKVVFPASFSRAHHILCASKRCRLGNPRAATVLGFFVVFFEVAFKKLQNAENDCCDRLELLSFLWDNVKDGSSEENAKKWPNAHRFKQMIEHWPDTDSWGCKEL